MPVHDFRSERLFVDVSLQAGAVVSCTRDQANYLCNVLRLKNGDEILVFNGADGEWRAQLANVAKRSCELQLVAQTRAQDNGPDIFYLFAPLKRARLDYMVQKATELGVMRLQPVVTHRTIASRVNVARMRSNVIEAAEQCGILRIPQVEEPCALGEALSGWPRERPLILCDEAAAVSDPLKALKQLAPGPVGVLVGPEGGFSEEERMQLASQPFVTIVSLGPRIMRADTAAVSILTLVNAVLGDWTG